MLGNQLIFRISLEIWLLFQALHWWQEQELGPSHVPWPERNSSCGSLEWILMPQFIWCSFCFVWWVDIKGINCWPEKNDGAAQLDFMELLFFTLSLENVPSARSKTAETDRLKPKLNIVTMLRLVHSTQWQPKWQPMKIVVESNSMTYWHRWLHDTFTVVTKGRTGTAVDWMRSRFCKKT